MAPIRPGWADTLQDRRVLVTGAGLSGASATKALVELGAIVTVTDDAVGKLDALAGAAPGLDGVDFVPGLRQPPRGTEVVVTSPGWRPDAPLLVAAARAGIEVIGEVELAWRLDAGRSVWLAVTGTNGKTTTVGMLESVLHAAGRAAVACGNVGLPVIDAVRSGQQVLAVELSSFQLHWAPSVRPAAGVVLNVAEDHLDWHGSMAAYAAAKARVLDAGVAVAGVDDPGAAALLAASPARRRVGITLAEPAKGQLGIRDGKLVDRAFGSEAGAEGGKAEGRKAQPLATVADVRPQGPPGLLDALAAAALARAVGVPAGAVGVGLRSFLPGAHRSVEVAAVGGVRYIDDSKATNPHAAAASLRAHRKVVWIAGGLLKGAPVDALVAEVAPRLVGAILIGTDRALLADALARHAPGLPVTEVRAGDDGAMTEAVAAAAGMARAGDVVLLAPAAASMDQFSDYAHRGRAFAEAVRARASSGG